MYKLMLVEDEEDVREGIIQEIDWSALGYEIVGTAENGKEAVELIERSVPDVVVTDIQMPFMDGMQLSEIIKARYPMTKVIILTGYDEFEYAQKAIKLHIDEYVLKPFSAQELIEVLKKVRDQIDHEISQKENVHILEEHYRKSLPVLREVFLASLLTRKLLQTEIEEKAFNYNLELNGNGFVVSVIRIDTYLEVEETLHSTNSAQSLRYSKDQELKLFALLNIAEEIGHKHELGRVYLHDGQVIVLTVSPSNDRELILKKTLPVLEEIRQSIDKYLKFTVTIGVGTVSQRITDVHYSYKDAIFALDYRLILGNNRVICIDDVEKRYVEKLRFDELKEHALIRCIKVGSASGMKETVEDLFQGIADAAVSYKEYQIYLLEIVTSLLRAAKDSSLDFDEVFGQEFNPFSEINRFTNLQEAKEWMLTLCTSMMNRLASDRQYTYKTLVEQAKEFTLQHYADSDITIQKVCNHLHISAGYFSSIFKKETKMTFVNYLMHIRMEEAKSLLRTTDLKAFEIADKVGYTDPNYFSFSFRKQVGISPKEYRNNDKED
jgi:two-component system response regulator YesN